MDARLPLSTATLVGFGPATREPHLRRGGSVASWVFASSGHPPFARSSLQVQRLCGFRSVVTAAATIRRLVGRSKIFRGPLRPYRTGVSISSISPACPKTCRRSGVRQMGRLWHGSKIRTEIPSRSPSVVPFLKRLTLPSSGRPKGRFAPLGPPLADANVGRSMNPRRVHELMRSRFPAFNAADQRVDEHRRSRRCRCAALGIHSCPAHTSLKKCSSRFTAEEGGASAAQ